MLPVLALGAVLGTDELFGQYKATQWLFTWDGGLPRGLVGSVLRVVLGDAATSYTTIHALGMVASAVGIVALVAVAWRAAKHASAVLLALPLVLSPFAVRYLAHDVGRTDVLAALAAGVALWIGLAVRPPVVATLGAALAMCVALCIHEASFVLHIPLLLVLLRLHWRQRPGRGEAFSVPHPRATNDVAALALLALACVFVLKVAAAPGESLDAQVAELAERADFTVVPEAVLARHADLATSIAMTFESRNWLLLHVDTLLLLVLVAAWSYPATRWTWHALSRRMDRRMAFVCTAAPFAPLALMPVAFDYWRWGSWAVMDACLLGLALVLAGRGDVPWRAALALDTRRGRLLLAAAVVLMAASLWAPGPAVMDTVGQRPLALLVGRAG